MMPQGISLPTGRAADSVWMVDCLAWYHYLNCASHIKQPVNVLLAAPGPVTSEALKALAVLTSHPVIREGLKLTRFPFADVVALLRAPVDPIDIQESAVTVLGNLAASRATAAAISKVTGLAELLVSLIDPTVAPSMQRRCALACQML